MMVSNLLIPRSVYAGTVTLTVNGDGTDTAGVYSGAPATFVNMQSDDDAISDWYAGTSGTPVQRSWTFTNTTATTINSVTVYAKGQRSNYGILKLYTKIGGTNYYDTTTYTDDTWTLRSKTWATSPATGLAWTMAEINAAEFGIQQANGGYGSPAPLVFGTYMYVVVDYTNTAPVSTTVAASTLTNNSALLNGTITSDGGTAVTDYGFVWDTTSRADPGNTAPTASVYANSWESGAGIAVGNISHSTGATLVADTTYYFRVAAENSVGWAYGSELTFKTVGIPTGTTDIATIVATLTARINATVTNDNGQLCDVRFGWGGASQATVAAYANQTAWVLDTYATASYPYVDLTGLAVGTPYFFRVAIRNDAGTFEGAEQTFTTGAVIGSVTNLKAIPTSTTVSLSWTKGTYSAYTLIRCSTGGYPVLTTDGETVYLNTNNSISMTTYGGVALVPGTTYYFTAWGKTSTFYSAAGTNILTTTLGYEAELNTLAGTTPTNSSFTRDPSVTKVSAIPLIGAMISDVATSYTIPVDMLWYFLWIMASAFIGIVMYNITPGKNLNVALTATLCFVGLGIYMELIMLWVLFFMLIISIGWILYGERR